MAKGTRTARPRAARLMSFTLAFFLMLLWSTGAYAQSREDQYGSPTDPVEDPAAGQVASGTLGVLPDTGGPSLLFAGTSFVVVATGVALVSRRNGRR